MLEKIFLIHHTHYDIGFTDLPDEVVQQQLLFLDEAVRLGEADHDYCWTIESGALLCNYLDFRPQKQAERLLNLLRSGQFEVGAFDKQLLTEVASFAELQENCLRTVKLGRKYGFAVQTAILDDIGGLASETPTLLNNAGIRYLIAGCGAFQTELPWANLPHLFYLQCKSGGRILVWNLGNDRNEVSCNAKHPYAVYGMASIFLGYRNYPELLGIHDLGIDSSMPEDNCEHRLSGKEVFDIFKDRLQKEKYPYSEILMQYGGGNRGPAPELAQLVRKLNATGMYPNISLTTPSGFFRLMEQKYAASIPVINGFLADPWNLRINAVPSVLKNHRKAQRLYDACRLKGLKDDAIMENLLLTSDHTFGLNTWHWQKSYEENGRSLSASCFDRFRQSWKCKSHYAETAMRRADALKRRSSVDATYNADKGVLIRNLAPHIISGNAELYLGIYSPKLVSLKYPDGREVARQQIGQNRWMLYIEDVPALGSLRLNPEFTRIYNESFNPEIREIPRKITSRFFELDIDEDGTISSVKSKKGKIIMQNGCGEMLSETIHDALNDEGHCGLLPSVKRTVHELSSKTGKILSDGELFTDVLQGGDFPYGHAERTVRIWKNLPRIDFSCRLDLPEQYEKNCYYVKFPFEGKQGHFIFDSNAGINTPDELLPGSMLDMFCCARFTALESQGFTAVLCCIDSPVLEFDGMHTCEWRKKLPLTFQNNHIYGLLYNNICNTDAPAWQRIIESFNYSLFIDGENFNTAFAQSSWYGATALNADLNYEDADEGIEGFPLSLRIHIDSENVIYIENPNPHEAKYKNLVLKPYELIKY